MSDKESTVAGCDIALIDGKFISLHESEEYVYGCAIKISEWEAVKTAIDKMIAEVKADENIPTANR